MSEKPSRVWRELWVDYFVGSTTIHGLPFLCARRSLRIRRVLWCVLLALCSGAFLYNFSQRLSYFLSDPINVNIVINERKSMPFPAITICNHNNFRLSKAAISGAYPYLIQLYGEGNVTNESIQFFSAKTDSVELVKELAHNKSSLIFKCKFSGETCYAENFTEVFTDFGVCYTFNGEISPAKKLSVRQSGSGYGLDLLINVEQYEYMEGAERTAGVKVLIHQPTSLIRVGDSGFNVPPGMQGLVGMQVTSVNNIPSAGNSCAEKKLRYFKGYKYSTALCDQECLTDYIISKCGCQLLNVPRLSSAVRFCTPTDHVSCILSELVVFREKGSDRCECPLSCTSTTFNPSLSYGALSRFNARQILQSINPSDLHRLKSDFLAAREVSARKRDWPEDSARFKVWNQLMDSLAVLEVKPEPEYLQQKLNEQLQHQCFKNARKLVADYSNLSRSAIEQISDRINPMTDYYRGSLVTAYAQLLWDTRMKLKFIKYFQIDPLLKLSQNGENDSAVVESLQKSLQTNVRKLTDTLEDLRHDINSTGRGFVDYILANSFFLNQSSFLAYFEGFKDFLALELKCVPELISLTKTGFETVQSELSFVLKRHSVTPETRLQIDEELEKILEKRTECQMIMINHARYGRESVERFARAIVAEVKRENNELYDYLEVIFERTEAFDFQTANGRTILKTMRGLESSFFSGNLKKRDLAFNITSSQFSNEVALFNEFIESVKSFISLSRQEMINYLEELGGITEQTLPIIRAYYELLEPNTHSLYFGGVLFAPEEIVWCQTQIDSFVSDRLKTLSSIQRQIASSVADFIADMHEFIRDCSMDTSFVMSNFLDLSIYYRELREEVINQQKAYEIWGLISDIGGGMGLFLGASFITIFEIIDTLCESIRQSVSKESSTEISPNETSSSDIKVSADGTTVQQKNSVFPMDHFGLDGYAWRSVNSNADGS